MKWQLTDITNAQWDRALSNFAYAQFTQSSAWKTFQESLGREVKRFIIKANNDDLLAMCQAVFVKKTIGSFWLAQRGPILSPQIDAMKAMQALADQALGLLGGDAWFFRVEPVPHTEDPYFYLANPWIRKKSHDPSVTRLVNIASDDEAILAQMHQKTRYNIRVSQKNSVKIEESDRLEDFLQLQKDTAARDHFVAQSDAYVTKQFEALKQNGVATLLIAKKDETALAANVLITFGDTVTYLYGASSSEQRNLMAPYLLHWASMQYAKKQGCTYYDLWGVNAQEKNHPDYKGAWEGISRFKAGWGGQIIELPGTYDLPLKRAWYRLAEIIKKI